MNLISVIINFQVKLKNLKGIHFKTLSKKSLCVNKTQTMHFSNY
jgi:hypothetical protein